MFVAAWQKIVKNWKEPKYSSVVNWKCDIYIMERGEIDLHTSTWIDCQKPNAK